MGSKFKVLKIIDGDTFDVSTNWEWNNEKGNRIRIANLNAPELSEYGGKVAKDNLEALILGKEVELRNPATLSYGRLVCDVYLNGQNLLNY